MHFKISPNNEPFAKLGDETLKVKGKSFPRFWETICEIQYTEIQCKFDTVGHISYVEDEILEWEA